MNPKDFMTPTELLLAKELEAAEALGEDLLDGEDPPETVAAAETPAEDGAEEAQAEETATTEEAAAEEGETATAEPEAAAEQTAASADEPEDSFEPETIPAAAPIFKATDPNGVEQRIANLEAQKGVLLEKYDEGVISREEYLTKTNAIERGIRDADRDLTRLMLSTEAQQLNEDSVLKNLADRVRKTIDYGNKTFATQFDTVLSGVRLNPDFASRPFSAQAAEAHRVVLALNGKMSTPPAAAPAPAAVAKVKNGNPPPPPKTLANIPSAAIPNTGTDTRTKLASLTGAALQQTWESMTPAQQKAALGE